MPHGAGSPGGPTNPNNPWVAGSTLSPAIVAMLKNGNFNGAFQAALSQSTVNDPGLSQLQQLMSPTALEASGVTWSPTTMAGYYNALSQNAPAIQKQNNIIETLGSGQGLNAQIASGNGGDSQYLGGTFGKTPPAVTNGNYVPNPIGNDYSPTFQNGHMGGVFGDIVNAAGTTVIDAGQAALIAGMAYAGGMGGGALAGMAGAGAGTLGAVVGTGAGAGAAGTAASDVVHNQPLTWGSVGKGALVGGVTGGLGYGAGPLVSSLQDAGAPSWLASGLVKGGIGAGVGAVGGALSGYGAGNGALVGGIGGATSGAIGSAAGNPQLGGVAGTIAGTLAGKYLTSPPTPKLPSAPGTAPPTATGTQGLPSLPGGPSGPPPSLPGGAPAPGAPPPTNIGSYSGYGYAPRQQVQNPVSDYSTYGQGPEAQFFQPAGTTQHPMVNVNQGTITPANST